MRRRESRKYVVQQIEDRMKEAIIDSDDETLAKVYEVLVNEGCEPTPGMSAEFIVDDDGF